MCEREIPEPDQASDLDRRIELGRQRDGRRERDRDGVGHRRDRGQLPDVLREVLGDNHAERRLVWRLRFQGLGVVVCCLLLLFIVSLDVEA